MPESTYYSVEAFISGLALPSEWTFHSSNNNASTLSLLSKSAERYYLHTRAPSFYYIISLSTFSAGLLSLILLFFEMNSGLFNFDYVVYLYFSLASFSLYFTNLVGKREWEAKHVEEIFYKFVQSWEKY